jgi:hypothetical protein
MVAKADVVGACGFVEKSDTMVPFVVLIVPSELFPARAAQMNRPPGELASETPVQRHR